MAADPYTEVWLYLDDIAPEVVVDYDNYLRCERETINPALEDLGYTLCGAWRTGDSDWFGPLTRWIETDRGKVCYGR